MARLSIAAVLHQHGYRRECLGGNIYGWVRRSGEVTEYITRRDPIAEFAPAHPLDVVFAWFEVGDNEASERTMVLLADCIRALQNPSKEYALLELRLDNGFHRQEVE